MLNQLSWLTLQTRRKLSRLQTLHKVFYLVFYQQISLPTYQHHDPRDSTIHQERIWGGGVFGALKHPPPKFYNEQTRKLLEAVVQVQLHFIHMYGQ